MAWNRQSRHERGYGTTWDKTRLRILARDCGLCQPCKRAGYFRSANEVDHIIPKAQGGTDDDDNLQAICSECHIDKGNVDRGFKVKQTIGLDGWPAGKS